VVSVLALFSPSYLPFNLVLFLTPLLIRHGPFDNLLYVTS